MALTARRRTLADAPAVIALHETKHAQGHVIPPTLAQVESATEREGREEWLVIDGDVPVGMWLIVLHSDWLVELRMIIAAVQGRGIGSYALMGVMRRSFDELGAHRLFLEVTIDNTAGRALYERFGWRLEGIARDGFQNVNGEFKDLCSYAILEHEFKEVSRNRLRPVN